MQTFRNTHINDNAMACKVGRSRLILCAAFLRVGAAATLVGLSTFSGAGSVPFATFANATAAAEAHLGWVVPVYASLSVVVVAAFVLCVYLCMCRQIGGAEVRMPLLTVTDE
jgi:hypothetical protein